MFCLYIVLLLGSSVADCILGFCFTAFYFHFENFFRQLPSKILSHLKAFFSHLLSSPDIQDTSPDISKTYLDTPTPHLSACFIHHGHTDFFLCPSLLLCLQLAYSGWWGKLTCGSYLKLQLHSEVKGIWANLILLIYVTTHL